MIGTALLVLAMSSFQADGAMAAAPPFSAQAAEAEADTLLVTGQSASNLHFYNLDDVKSDVVVAIGDDPVAMPAYFFVPGRYVVIDTSEPSACEGMALDECRAAAGTLAEAEFSVGQDDVSIALPATAAPLAEPVPEPAVVPDEPAVTSDEPVVSPNELGEPAEETPTPAEEPDGSALTAAPVAEGHDDESATTSLPATDGPAEQVPEPPPDVTPAPEVSEPSPETDVGPPPTALEDDGERIDVMMTDTDTVDIIAY